MNDFLLGLACVAAGIFTLYKREGYVKVELTELSEIYGAHETPSWKRYFRVTITIAALISILLGVVWIAKGIGLITFWEE